MKSGKQRISRNLFRQNRWYEIGASCTPIFRWVVVALVVSILVVGIYAGARWQGRLPGHRLGGGRIAALQCASPDVGNSARLGVCRKVGAGSEKCERALGGSG